MSLQLYADKISTNNLMYNTSLTFINNSSSTPSNLENNFINPQNMQLAKYVLNIYIYIKILTIFKNI